MARPRKPPENLIEFGRVAGAYGVQGWLKVTGAELDTLAAVRSWWIGGEAHEVAETKAHSGTLLARLAGIESREHAQALKGRTVAVPRNALPKLGEGQYYRADLLGLEVVNAQGLVLGVVKGMFSNGAHDVIELAGEKPRLLPWVPAVVKKVDLPERRIEVEWGADW